MIIPIRCFTCNKLIADKWNEYLNLLQIELNKLNLESYQDEIDNETRQSIELKILDQLKLTKYCCRRMILSHVDLCEKI